MTQIQPNPPSTRQMAARDEYAQAPADLAAGPTTGPLTPEELQLGARNHSMPLEALRRDITPPGLHYVLTHFDIPDIDTAAWHLRISGAVERANRRKPTIAEKSHAP